MSLKQCQNIETCPCPSPWPKSFYRLDPRSCRKLPRWLLWLSLGLEVTITSCTPAIFVIGGNISTKKINAVMGNHRFIVGPGILDFRNQLPRRYPSMKINIERGYWLINSRSKHESVQTWNKMFLLDVKETSGCCRVWSSIANHQV